MSRWVLTPEELRLVERLRLQPRRAFGGRVRGERLTRAKGTSIEFSDYREYTEGDDLRHLDWSVLARLDQTIVKTYQDEEDLAVHLLVDDTASMTFGEPSKLNTAQRMACALGHIALMGGDAVFPRSLTGQGGSRGALRGRVSYPRLADWAQSLGPTSSSVNLAKGLRAFASSSARLGLVIVLSDGLDPDCQTALRAIAARGHEVWMLQILSRLETDPDLEGDLRLVDAETQSAVEITANRGTLRAYQENLRRHSETLADACRRGGGRHAQMLTETSLSGLVKNVWRREGWVA